jgi:hypothetical protein
VRELPAHAAAEIEPQARGLLVRAAVVAREAAVEHARQILGRDADAGVLDDERRAGRLADRDGARVRVFERVREHLLHDEEQPLLVREHARRAGLVAQSQLFTDEERRIPAQRLAHDVVERAAADDEVGRAAAEALVLQRHFDVLLDGEELLRERLVGGVVPLLQQQPHGRDGRLDLVGPERVVRVHVAELLVLRGDELRALLLQRAHERLVVALQKVCGLGEVVLRQHGARGELPQKQVAAAEARAVKDHEGRADQRAQRGGVADVVLRHAAQLRHQNKNCPEGEKKRERAEARAQIRAKKLHLMRYPRPFLVTIQSCSPTDSSFLRSRATLTVSVFSSTKLSDSHSRCMSVSRETILPPACSSTCTMRYSFFVRSSVCPSYESVVSPVDRSAPPRPSRGAAAANS